MPYSAVKRIGISIPDPVLKDLQALVPERQRSAYIVKALREKLEDEKKRTLHEKMMAGYAANAATDAETAETWRAIEEEADALAAVREPQHAYRRKTGGPSKKK